jgi:hypothetical protein
MRIILPLLVFLGLANFVSAQSAFLGVELTELGQAQGGGAFIAGVQEPSAASLMGIVAGDLITSIDGQAIASGQELQSLIARRLPGEIAEFTLHREGQTVTLLGVLGRSPELSKEHFGLRQVPSHTFPLAGFEGLFGAGIHDEHLLESLRNLHSMQGENGFGFPFPSIEFQFHSLPNNLGGNVERKVTVQYPASTPKEERSKMIKDAKAKYGDDAEVTFEGNATMIRVQTQSTTRRERQVAPAEDEEL